MRQVLRRNGLARSKKLEGDEDVDSEPDPGRPGGPGAGARRPRRPGLYRNSLSIVLLSLVAVSFLLHAVGGAEEYGEEQAADGQPRPSCSHT